MTAMNLVNMCRGGLLAFMIAAGVGCSDMDPARDTYQSVYGIRTAGTGGDGPSGGGPGGSAGTDGEPPGDFPMEWACLETPPPPYMPPMPLPTTINYLVPVADFDSRMAVAGLQAKLCNSSTCTPDIPMPALVQPDMARPVYLLQLPYGLPDSYVEFSAEGYATLDYYFGGPLIGSPNNPFVGNAIPMLRQETLDRLLVDVRAPSPSGPGRGVLAIRTINCMGQRAEGVVVEPVGGMPDGAVAWTLSDNNIANPGAKTDLRGVAGFANVPMGAVRVQGVAPVDDGVEYGAHTLRVKPGQITLGEVRLGIGRIGL